MRRFSTLAAFSLIVELALRVAAQETVVTYVAKPALQVPPYISETTFEFKTNQVVTVVGATGDSMFPGEVELHFGGGVIVRGGGPTAGGFETPIKLGHKYAGLTKIVAKNSSLNGYAFTLAVSEPGKDPTSVPTGTVVIPSDSAGPVRIVLESSTDLVNWVEANPGTYAKDHPNRFFRVRAVNQ